MVHVADTFWNGVYPFIDYSTGGSIDGQIRLQSTASVAFSALRQTAHAMAEPSRGAASVEPAVQRIPKVDAAGARTASGGSWEEF